MSVFCLQFFDFLDLFAQFIPCFFDLTILFFELFLVGLGFRFELSNLLFEAVEFGLLGVFGTLTNFCELLLVPFLSLLELFLL